MPDHRYIDLIGNNLVIKTPNARTSQIWYFDQTTKTVKNKSNNRSFDIQSSGRSSNMQVWNTNSMWWQLFKYEGENIKNVQNNKCFDVTGGKDMEGQNVQVYSRHNKANQRWKIVYIDKAEKEETSGLDKDFGFHINRPFIIQSRLPMKRVAELVGARNIVLKTLARGRTAQQFYFDIKSKTIKSQQYKDRSLNIAGNGRSSNLEMITTNSRWW